MGETAKISHCEGSIPELDGQMFNFIFNMWILPGNI